MIMLVERHILGDDMTSRLGCANKENRVPQHQKASITKKGSVHLSDGKLVCWYRATT